MLRTIFTSLTQIYTGNHELAETLWSEIETNYSDSSRHYHTLAHLENLLKELLTVKSHIEDWDTTLFSLFYHDIIYNPSRNDNEEQSAEVASERLQSLGVHQDIISECVLQIIATKTHSISPNSDTNIFTDADLSILVRIGKCTRSITSRYEKNI